MPRDDATIREATFRPRQFPRSREECGFDDPTELPIIPFAHVVGVYNNDDVADVEDVFMLFTPSSIDFVPCQVLFTPFSPKCVK